jgi:hypothetical protein
MPIINALASKVDVPGEDVFGWLDFPHRAFYG